MFEIFKISYTDEGNLRIEANAATEMSFEIKNLKKLDYAAMMKDILSIAFPLLMADVATAELYDGNPEAYTGNDHVYLWRLNQFAKKYHNHLVNVDTDLLALEQPNGR